MRCPLCQSDSFEEFLAKDIKASKKISIALCNRCGLVFQNPLPCADELKEYYSHNYRADYKQTYTPKSKHIYRAGKTALKRIEFLRNGGILSGKLLDIGAGGGEFTYLSSKVGFDSCGIEPNIGYSEYAKESYGSDITTGSIDDISGTYDVITMFHVLEHIPTPLDVFFKLYHSLNKEGVVFIEVPWIETNDASPDNIYFKAHIIYFGIDTLVASASRYFDVVQIDTTSNLKILFRAKITPTELKLPNEDSVKSIKKRLEEKGWIEYLFKGKGLLKPFKKVCRMVDERKAKGKKPKEILDELFV